MCYFDNYLHRQTNGTYRPSIREKAYEELKLIMTTFGVKFIQQTQVLIKAMKGKV